MWQLGTFLWSNPNTASKAKSTNLTLEYLEDRRLMAGLFGGISRVQQPPVSIDPTVAWIDQNIQDAPLRTLVRQLSADRVLSRNDMISIFNQVAGGGVTASEFNDLQDIVNRPDLLGTPYHVQNLAGKVVNGDRANAFFQGSSLGNLRAGSSSVHLNRLTAKWFLGADRPTLPANMGLTYMAAAGTLFGSGGPSYIDVDQGALGDCWFLASLEEVAFRSPSLIQNMFIDNGDNTFSVRFFHNGNAEYVTVDRFLPVDAFNTFAFANTSDAFNDASNALWAALAEKAYAQINESGWIGSGGVNSYWALDGGWPDGAMSHLTGQSVVMIGMADGAATLMGSAIGNDFLSGRMITFCSDFAGVDANIVAGHCYAMLGYEANSGTFTLGNPWGTDAQVNGLPGGIISLSTHALFENFQSFAITNPSQTVTMIDTILRTQEIPVVWDPLILDLIPNIIDYTIPIANNSISQNNLRWSSVLGSDTTIETKQVVSNQGFGYVGGPSRSAEITIAREDESRNARVRSSIVERGSSDSALMNLAKDWVFEDYQNVLSFSPFENMTTDLISAISDVNELPEDVYDDLFAELGAA